MLRGWTYQGIPVISFKIPDDVIGFVYQITTEKNKKYIGKKLMYSRRKRKYGKREIAKLTDKRLKHYEHIIKENDWRDYTGSNKELNKDIANGVKYTKEILSFHTSRMSLTYYENKELYCNDAIVFENFYNDNIGGKFFRGKI